MKVFSIVSSSKKLDFEININDTYEENTFG